MSSNLYKTQYLKVIKIVKEAESNLEDEINLYLNNQNLLNAEVVRNNVPKSNDWTILTLFGICEATVLNFLNRVIIAIRSLRSEYIVWPSENYRQEVNTGFEQIQGFPIVIGAIDESHIPLYEAPSKDNKDVYMSCKQKYGIYLQDVVDHQGFFISYEIGWPASVHDAKVFSNSDIFKNYKNYFKEEDYLIANSAYPLLPWVMPPFKDPQGSQAQQQTLYNIAHSKTRVVVEQAFGCLKAQFPLLKEIRVKDTKKASDIIDIALILHNFIEKHNNIWGNKDNEPYRIEREYAKIKQQNLLEIILNYS
ncbi:20275_t:CDS:2 [Gigaspora margarita]|uniref:20275_t:CDS:1 n=1 Tax=Gigaspora margarita TaxID=4874 RepID=A0ABN7VND9_GIGMA|nr:20275_t:CDS:2 [Gigaspora margarita]